MQRVKRTMTMREETSKANSSEGTAEKELRQDGNTVRSNHGNSAIIRKLSGKLRFWILAVLYIIVFVAGVYAGYHLEHKLVSGKTLKFMTHKEELTVEQFSADPIDNRDFAWDAEDVPEFIVSDTKNALMLNYDGVEYSFGENKICIEKRSSFTGDNYFEITVNTDLGWSMSNFSIYSSGENIVIYGYWNDEFRRITLGKTQESIVKDVLTINPNVPFSAEGKYISEQVKEDYIVAISKDMRTVSVYKEKSIVGEDIVLPDEILGFYDANMILANSDDDTYKLYMPYIVNNNGKEEFVCPEVATVTKTEVDNVSDTEYMDIFYSYTTEYSARVGNICCYIFENEDGRIRMIIPNDIQRYSAYKRGTDILKPEDDLGWHWVTINE